MVRFIPVKKTQRQNWQQSKVRQELRDLECQYLARLSDRLFGRFMLQMGGGCPEVELPGLRKLVFLAESGADGADLIGKNAQLPLATSSVNAVFLSHVLEFARDPHSVLREVDRVLIPGGRLVIALYNPWSLFALLRFLRPGQSPWSGRLPGPGRVVEWLSVLGFELEQRDHLGHLWPLRHSKGLARIERLGNKLWPKGAAVVILVATKRELPMNIIRPRWAAKAAPGLVVGGVVESGMKRKHRD